MLLACDLVRLLSERPRASRPHLRLREHLAIFHFSGKPRSGGTTLLLVQRLPLSPSFVAIAWCASLCYKCGDIVAQMSPLKRKASGTHDLEVKPAGSSAFRDMEKVPGGRREFAE